MKISNLPNILTLTRALCVPIIIVGIYSGRTWALALATFLFILASITDHLDGYIARKYNLITSFGIFFDPIVDKLMMLSLFFVFADLELIPIWMALLLLLRELLISGLREVGSLKGRVVGADWTGKAKIRLQIVLIIFILFFLLGRSLNHAIIYGREIIYYGTLINVLLSFVFLYLFFRRNRELLLK